MRVVSPGRRASLKSRLAVFAALSGCGLTAILSSSAPAADTKAKVGKLPKDSVARHQMATLDGRRFSLAGLRGQVVVIDFFAVWCGHSRAHIPALTRFGDEERQRGLQVIGLAVQDRETSLERLMQFIKDQRIGYPVGLVADKVFADFVRSRDVSVPQTLVFGRDGRLAAHFVGHSAEADAALAAAVARELEKR